MSAKLSIVVSFVVVVSCLFDSELRTRILTDRCDVRQAARTRKGPTHDLEDPVLWSTNTLIWRVSF